MKTWPSMLCVTLSMVLLSGCSGNKIDSTVITGTNETQKVEEQTPQPSVPTANAGAPLAPPSDLPNPAGQVNLTLIETEHFNFSVPAGWTYELVSTDDEPISSISAMLRPEDKIEGGICIQYCDGFGVCGTGLEEKDYVFTMQDIQAQIGYYDGNPAWSFIVLTDEDYNGFSILNEAPWYEEYESMIDVILDNIYFKAISEKSSVG